MDSLGLSPEWVAEIVINYIKIWDIRNTPQLLKSLENVFYKNSVSNSIKKEDEFSLRLKKCFSNVGYKDYSLVFEEIQKKILNAKPINVKYSGNVIQKRSHEDIIIMEPFLSERFSLFAVLDGHGASKTEKNNRVAERVKFYLLKYILTLPERKLYPNDFVDMMEHINSKIKKEWDEKKVEGGCVVSFSILDKKYFEMWMVNLGDSPMYLLKDGKIIWESIQHSPNLPEERKRIESVGGKVVDLEGYGILRVIYGDSNTALAVSRAIGDFEQQPAIGIEPSVMKKTIESGLRLVIGSDGTFEGIPKKDLESIISNPPDDILLYSNLTTDDCSVIVVELK